MALLTSFSGYLARPPVTEGSLMRYAVLHVLFSPWVTLALIGAWWLLARGYDRDASPRPDAGR
jgi:hypothetical protein